MGAKGHCPEGRAKEAEGCGNVDFKHVAGGRKKKN